MGTSLRLVLPDDVDLEQVLYEYCKKKIKKQIEARGEPEKEDPRELFLYKYGVQRIENDEQLLISEKIPSKIATVADMDSITGLFGWPPSPVYDGKIDHLLGLFEDAKAELQRRDDEHYANVVEIQFIGLLEFALEHDYGIDLSM